MIDVGDIKPARKIQNVVKISKAGDETNYNDRARDYFYRKEVPNQNLDEQLILSRGIGSVTQKYSSRGKEEYTDVP